MSLVHIIPNVGNASLERGYYHKLSFQDLDKLDDAEALFERGRRLRTGTCNKKDEKKGWELMSQAAELGHPVAQAAIFERQRMLDQAVELYLASAERGHASGFVFSYCYAC
jgi:hypothetical protein